jgi:hypothetical protein
MNSPLVKIALLGWMACNVLVFTALTLSPYGKIAVIAPPLLVLRELLWPLFYRASMT